MTVISICRKGINVIVSIKYFLLNILLVSLIPQNLINISNTLQFGCSQESNILQIIFAETAPDFLPEGLDALQQNSTAISAIGSYCDKSIGSIGSTVSLTINYALVWNTVGVSFTAVVFSMSLIVLLMRFWNFLAFLKPNYASLSYVYHFSNSGRTKLFRNGIKCYCVFLFIVGIMGTLAPFLSNTGYVPFAMILLWVFVVISIMTSLDLLAKRELTWKIQKSKSISANGIQIKMSMFESIDSVTDRIGDTLLRYFIASRDETILKTILVNPSEDTELFLELIHFENKTEAGTELNVPQV